MAAAGAVPDVKSLVAKHCADGALPLFGADKSDVAPEAFALEEIGDGNLNFVWRVSQSMPSRDQSGPAFAADRH